jgi:hypothetical protein
MRIRREILGYAACSLLWGCGSSGNDPASTEGPAAEFSPPAPEAGYTRYTAPSIPDLEPGADVMRCQYILAPFDRDMDVLDVSGYQSRGGHHSLAYAVKGSTAPLGTSRKCNDEDNTKIGAFLGGIGGEGGKATLPPGVVFRLTKGSAVMLNTHFLNATADTLTGETVIDIKFAEVDTTRKVASMFANVNLDFTIDPQATSSADATCVVQHDLSMLKFTNHMHNYGTTAVTTIVRQDGTEEMLHADDAWVGDMQFNPSWSDWPVASPMVVKQGDTMRTHCEWANSTTNALKFPDEMCVGFGFFLTDTATAPVCLGGSWSE